MITGHDGIERQAYLHSDENTGLKVLIVDDSSFDCENIKRQCRRTSLYLSIDTASDVEQMRKALDQTKYDIIFIDYHLTNETGLQARHVISEHPHNAQAATIMITGDVCHEIAVSAIQNGCKDHVDKADLDAMSLEMMMKSATRRLEKHANRVLQTEMDAVHDKTVSAMTQIMKNELSDDRIVSLFLRALQQVTYIDGVPVLQKMPDITSLFEKEQLDSFDFAALTRNG